MSKSITIFSSIFIVLLSLLASISMTQTLNSAFLDELRGYAHEDANRMLYLYNISEDQQMSVMNAVMDSVEQHHGVILRSDSILNQKTSDLQGYRFGFAGDIDRHSEAVAFSFLGTQIFNQQSLSSLFQAARHNPQATLGLDQVSNDVVAPLPSIAMGAKIVVTTLGNLVQQSKTVNGAYRVIGLNDNDWQACVHRIAALLNKSPDSITHLQHGEFAEDSLLPFMILCSIIAIVIALMFVLILGIYQSMPRFGIFMMLGWSRLGYLRSLYTPLAIVFGITTLIPFVVTIITFEHFNFSFSLFMSNIGTIVCTACAVLIAVAVASLTIVTVKPVNAIKNNISSRVVAILLVGFYVLSTIGVTLALPQIDGPLNVINNMMQVQRRWSQYSSLEILYKENIGNNSHSITSQSNEHSKEYYRWYQSFEGQPGAYIAHTSYFDEKVLDIWRSDGGYQHVPDKPFWSFVMSPNYLEQYGFSIPQDVLTAAKEGVRIFYIPDTLNAQERLHMEQYLIEESNSSASFATHDFENNFVRNKQIRFITYTPHTSLFTWTTDTNLPNSITDPILLVATTQNMSPSEYESLWAGGLENSYLKFSGSALHRYLSHDYLSKYHLDDNNPQFVPVKNFIAGLQKTLSETIALFGVVIAIVFILELIIMIAIVKIFVISRREEIAVKRLMGYSLLGIFFPPIVFVWAGGFVAVAASWYMRCTIGIAALSLFTVLQILILLLQARRAANAQIVSLIKSM